MDLKEDYGAGPRHPWEVSRFEFFTQVLQQTGVASAARRVLDVGAGDAWFARRLLGVIPEGAEVTCWDSGYEAVENRQHPDSPRITLVRDQPAKVFDAVLMLDVLEHVPNDREFLGQIVDRNLDDRSRLLISVPAWPSLWSSHDTALEHQRRYRPQEGARLLREAGLTVLRSGGLFHSLLIPRAGQVLLERLRTRSERARVTDQWNAGRAVTAAVQAVLRADNRLSDSFCRVGLEIPGLSWWALCAKA